MEREEFKEFLEANPKAAKYFLENRDAAIRQSELVVRLTSPRRVIFLDVDEVIQTQRAKLLGLYICPVAISLINRLAIETNASIVYSSVWRSYMPESLDAYKLHQAFGFTCSIFHSKKETDQDFWRTDSTTKVGRGDRELQVKRWLEAYPEVEDFVIIDDSWCEFTKLRSKMVAIDGLEGFGVRDYYRAKSILLNGEVDVEHFATYPTRAMGCVAHREAWGDQFRKDFLNEENLTNHSGPTDPESDWL